jgi:hypothetical protein
MTINVRRDIYIFILQNINISSNSTNLYFHLGDTVSGVDGSYSFITTMPPSYGPPRHINLIISAPGVYMYVYCYMFIYMCIYMYILICIYWFIYVYKCICMYIWLRWQLLLHHHHAPPIISAPGVYIYQYLYVLLFVHIRAYMYVDSYMCINVNVFIWVVSLSSSLYPPHTDHPDM